MIRILIVDDHKIVREGLRILLDEEADFEIVGEAALGREVVEMADALTPDVLLLDLVLPDLSGIEVTRQVMAHHPHAHILLLTSFAEDQNVVAAMQAGATGYMLKDVLRDDLVAAIRRVARGEPALHPEAQRKLIAHIAKPPLEEPDLHDLTEREREVLACLAQGLSNKQIAQHLHITEGTVKGHVSNILSKLHLEDRTQAAVWAVKIGLK
ncbi:MAG TPA: response regulator transcription factor [Anaerolineales bacterium]|nr:response regulator transcription factor [Anaerolineales bacterium]